MKNSDRSQKAQEVHAEQLLKLSTSLMTAFFVVILIVPISAVVSTAFSGVNIAPKDALFNLFGSWYGIVLLVAEGLLFYLVGITKESALDIYDKLYPDSESET